MPYLNRLRSGTLLYLRLMVVAFGIAINLFTCVAPVD